MISTFMIEDMSIEKQIELLTIWPKKVLIWKIQKFGCLIFARILLILILKIIVGLYLIVCFVGSNA